MTAERWRRVDEVLGGALERNASARDAFLAQACGDDLDLRAEVESLLAFETEAERAVEEIVKNSAEQFDARALGLEAGDRVGPYRIVREVGRGGMGTVYEAVRDDSQFTKRVAVKLVTRGMDTAALLGRFRHERQILARLEHPYIARLLDGGSTPDGRPYLVMEFVEGKPITAYCSEHRLDTAGRIELFRKVCAAVQSAHQNLVVHRDLKPGNILVDSNGTPKLLDFGIAKLLSADETAQLTVAAPGAQMLTPDYASPEQVRREAITTASDVYSLGVILYELLAGVRPHRLHNYSITEIERVVCQEDPLKPSEASRNTSERGDVPPLRSGDLDNIVLMALQKEPARRYGSAAELSEDLHRYVQGLPVRARQDTLTYRARKFICRHRTSVAASALLVASLAGFAAIAVSETHRARRRFNEVRGISHAVLYDIHDAISDLPGSVKARETIVKTALRYLDGLAREAGGDADIQLELATAYQRVGDVQGEAKQRSLGQTEEALKSYRKALEISDQLGVQNPSSVPAATIRLTIREKLGDMAARRGNDSVGAMEFYRQGIDIGEAAMARGSLNLEARTVLAGLYIDLARENHDSAQSIVAARKGLALMEKLAQEDSRAVMRQQLSEGYSMLGSSLVRVNELDQALESFQKAVRVREMLTAADPLNARYQRQLMIAYSKVGDVLGPVQPSLQDPAGAMESFRKMLAIAEKLAAVDPSDARAAFDRGMALRTTGAAFPVDRDYTASLAMLHKSRAIFEELAAKDAKDRNAPLQSWLSQVAIAKRLAEAGDPTAAIRAYREVIRHGAGLSVQNRKNLNILRGLFTSSLDTARLLAASLNGTEALVFSKGAMEVAGRARAVDPDSAVTQSWEPVALAAAADIQVRFARSREDWVQAREWFEKSAAEWARIRPQHGWPKNRDSELERMKAESERCAKALASFH